MPHESKYQFSTYMTPKVRTEDLKLLEGPGIYHVATWANWVKGVRGCSELVESKLLRPPEGPGCLVAPWTHKFEATWGLNVEPHI